MTEGKSNIIIVGAGAAGLNAALHLADQFHVVLLEARSRIGGRIHTLENADFSFPVELGAEFIHGNLQNTLELVRKYNLQLNETGGIPIRFENGKLVPSDFYFDHWDLFAAELKKLKEDIPIAEFLDLYFADDTFQSLRKSIIGFAEGYDAADTNFASTFALRDEWLNERDETQFRLEKGYSALMRCMADEIQLKGGEILPDTAVTHINWKKNFVEVICSSGKKYNAEKIILTVPVGVMQSDSIRFSPEIDSVQEAFQKLGNGHVIKILIQFENKFWESIHTDPALEKMGFLFTGNAIPTWWTQYPSAFPLLTGWLAGPAAWAMKNKSEEELFEISLHALSEAFGLKTHEIASKILAKKIVNWSADAYAAGAYSYATVGATEARKIIMQGVEDTIYFAGEALYEGKEMGTAEAALASGKSISEVLL